MWWKMTLSNTVVAGEVWTGPIHPIPHFGSWLEFFLLLPFLLLCIAAISKTILKPWSSTTRASDRDRSSPHNSKAMEIVRALIVRMQRRWRGVDWRSKVQRCWRSEVLPSFLAAFKAQTPPLSRAWSKVESEATESVVKGEAEGGWKLRLNGAGGGESAGWRRDGREHAKGKEMDRPEIRLG